MVESRLSLLLGAFLLLELPSIAELKVASMATHLSFPTGIPLAGYGTEGRRENPGRWLWNLVLRRPNTFFKASRGELDPIRAKVFFLKNGSHQLLFVSIDTVAVDDRFYRDLNEQIQRSLGDTNVIVSATHTHSGPGALSRSWYFQILASDRYQNRIYRSLLSQVLSLSRRAFETAQPAYLVTLSQTIKNVQRNRRGHVDGFDPEARLLVARTPQGEILGGILNFGVHPITLDDQNQKLSADLSGEIERALEVRYDSKGAFQMIQSIAGDVSPTEFGVTGARQLADHLMSQLPERLDLATPVAPKWSVASKRIQIPKGRIQLAACDLPIQERLRSFRWFPGKKALPREVQLSALYLGSLKMLTWPGEPTHRLGQRAVEQIGTNTWHLTLAQGYSGYLIDPSEKSESGLEVCANYHGADAGTQILENQRDLLWSLQRP
jgi:hypothetical protein